jgi:serine/threonine-protein kinase
MAEVFLAQAYGASGFEKRVAVKTLLPELVGDPEFERLLIEEARLGARLSHRSLVQVHDLGVAAGTYWVRMDWVDGCDLARLRAAAVPAGGDEPGVLGTELALLVALEVVHALEYVHSLADDDGRPLGLVHRDVSPSNVLLSKWGEVKLADFGIAKATRLTENTRASIRRGKYAYMSPEQVSGEPLSSQSDQFGFGVMLFELLMGYRPFDGPSPSDTMDRIREAAPPDVSRLPTDLGAVILRCLARGPSDRFPDAAVLRRQLVDARARRPSITIAELGAAVRRAAGEAPRRAAEPSTRPTR